jgi:L-ascorbate metabolism protein UlaG (beta-lactamase superfamily)
MIDYITWYGHATMKLKGEKVVYIDPYEMKQKTYEPADIVLVTHDHYDHCSPGDIAKVAKANTVIIAPASCKKKLKGNVKIIAAGETMTEQGVQIEAVPAYNLGKMFHQKSAGGLGYIVTLKGKRIYQAGDTDFIPEMKQIKADVAILPVGGTYTMTAEEAAEAANTIHPEIAIPMHFGSIVGSASDAETFKRLADVPVEILTRAKS